MVYYLILVPFFIFYVNFRSNLLAKLIDKNQRLILKWLYSLKTLSRVIHMINVNCM